MKANGEPVMSFHINKKQVLVKQYGINGIITSARNPIDKYLHYCLRQSENISIKADTIPAFDQSSFGTASQYPGISM